jgi:hypothetical protein
MFAPQWVNVSLEMPRYLSITFFFKKKNILIGGNKKWQPSLY